MIDDKVENFSDASESVFSQFVFQGFVVYKGLDINEYIITKNYICDDKNYYNLEILSDYEELKSETLKDLKI